MAETSKSFPNIPVIHWLSLRGQFKRTIPGTITSNYLASVLKMSEINAKVNILPSLKQIGLIDSDGKTNQELAKQLRDDALYPKLCNSILVKIYPQELRDAFPDKDSDKEQIKTWFMNNSGIGNSAAGRISAFYTAILEADLTPPKPGVVKKTQDAKIKPAKKKPQGGSVLNLDNDSSNEVSKEPKVNQNQKSKGPDLNINIQIHISSDASSDQIKSIFENMAKYIYKD
jgi:hypothetical protein